MLKETTKLCPGCGKELQAPAEVCDGCGTTFEVVEHGYCAQCHAVMTGRAETCSRCGGPLIDVAVESRPRAGPGPAVPPPRTAPSLEQVPPPPATPPVVQAAPRMPARRRTGATLLVWVAGVALLLVGIAGFVIADVAKSHDDETFAKDYAALGDRDATTSADALDAQVTKVNAAFGDYVAAADEVRTRHEAVTNAFNDALASPGPATRARVDRAVSRYAKAVAREGALRRAYFTELRSLKRELGR